MGSVDRLGDIRGAAAAGGEEEDVEAAQGPAPGQGFMADFFQEVGRIKAKISVIKRNIKLIEQKHQSSLVAISVDANKRSADELEALMDETNDVAQEVRNDLKKLDAECKAAPSETADGRIRTNMQNTLGRKFMETMTEYQETQKKFKDKFKDRVARQFKIVNPGATQEEIEEVVQGGNGGSVFADKILSASHSAAKNALADIQEKHQDIVKLERSLEELHQLFVDMSILVESQGELLNQIEYSVEQSVAYVEEGVVELNKASEYQKSARKVKPCPSAQTGSRGPENDVSMLLLDCDPRGGVGGGARGAQDAETNMNTE